MDKFQFTLTTLLAVVALVVFIIASCSTSKKAIIPLTNKPAFEDTYTIIWNGYSKAYIFKGGQWLRAESFDYSFDVIQKRYDTEWKSVKSLHRVHPHYNGKAGSRDQTMYFEAKYTDLKNNTVRTALHSSLGEGTGSTDPEFRNCELDIALANASAFMPYNRIRIRQHYDYENGKLTETVELVKVHNGKETPFMKNEEEAYFYIKGKLDKAPTVFQ